MAFLSGVRTDRAQLLLVGAIGIAVLLVVLAVMLNTAIYTESVANDAGTAYDERSAMLYVDTVHRGVGGIIVGVSTQSDGTQSEAELIDNLTEDVDRWSELAGTFDARDGTVTRVDVEDTIPGTRILQDEDGNFTNANGSSEWTLTTDADTLLEFRMNVSAADLHQPDNGTCERSDGCFRATVTDDDGTDSHLHLSADEAGNVSIEVETPVGWEECPVSGERADIDLVAGTVEGDRCDAITAVLDGSTPFSIAYSNADNISGEYALTTDGDVDPTAYSTNRSSPRTAPAIVGADVTVSYRSSSLTYITELQIRPGETDD